VLEKVSASQVPRGVGRSTQDLAAPHAVREDLGSLDRAAIGQATQQELRGARAHAAKCLTCRLLLTRGGEISRRLALLRIDEPRIDVVDQVMQQIFQEP
jgi:hypothetical protein